MTAGATFCLPIQYWMKWAFVYSKRVMRKVGHISSSFGQPTIINFFFYYIIIKKNAAAGDGSNKVVCNEEYFRVVKV